MCNDARDIMQQLKPPMCEIDYSVFEEIQDSYIPVFLEIQYLVWKFYTHIKKWSLTFFE